MQFSHLLLDSREVLVMRRCTAAAVGLSGDGSRLSAMLRLGLLCLRLACHVQVEVRLMLPLSPLRLRVGPDCAGAGAPPSRRLAGPAASRLM